MTEQLPTQAAAPETVAGGGGMPAAGAGANDPVQRAVDTLQLLGAEAREQVLGRMDPAIAEKIRMRIETTPDDRPNGAFSADVAERRRMLRELAERVHARRTGDSDQAATQLDGASAAAAARAESTSSTADFLPNGERPAIARQAPTGDQLERLRSLHPAAIARAMQGERAEAWALVLDRLDVNARAALQMYLDGSARAAIEDARGRQAELAATAPALLATIEAAIARTVVPRAMREHHQLLSTTPITWHGGAA